MPSPTGHVIEYDYYDFAPAGITSCRPAACFVEAQLCHLKVEESRASKVGSNKFGGPGMGPFGARY
jgi:hypothetical protein